MSKGFEIHAEKVYVLHRFKNDGVITHPEVVICAPDFDLVLWIASVSDGELCGKTVDVVEVAVRSVLMLLLQLCGVELLVVKAPERSGLLCLGRGRMEGATSRNFRSRRLSSSFGFLRLLRLCQVFCHPGGGKRLGCVRALLDIGTGGGRENTLVMMEVIDLCVTCNAGIASYKLSGANLESGTHNRALCSALREL